MEYGKTDTISYGSGILEFGVPEILIEADKDSEYTGSFDVRVCTDFELSGHVYTTDGRMQTPNQDFCGKKLQIPFVYDTTGMDSEDFVRGEFCLITNAGEFLLPYEVRIKGKNLQSDLGEIRNLFHFANLARVNWEQAKECFVSPLFSGILTGSGKQYAESYKILLQYGYDTGCMDSAMDRFLILIHKKQPVTFECKVTEYRFSREDIPESLQIEIQKTGWGHAELEIETKGGIARADQRFSDGDFKEDKVILDLKFDKSALHAGENRTGIYQKGEQQPLCEIIVSLQKDKPVKDSAKWQEALLKAGVTRLYLDYRTGRRPIRESLKKAEKLLARFRGADELLPALYEAHLKLLKGHGNEAVWLLKNAKRMLREKDVPMDEYGYFLYLLAMSGDDQQIKAGHLLDDYAKEHPEMFVLYWGCMHKDNLIKENPAAVYRRLRQYFEAGCTSPVLYMEAAFLLMEKDSVLMSSLTDFEIQVLLFMERYSLLTDALTEKIYRVPFSVRKLCMPFIQLCKKHLSKDADLSARMMCRLYMKNDCKGRDASFWLRKGIQSDCRINGLYEAYIRSLKLDAGEKLPAEVIRYYAYDTALEDRNLAYVYEKVLKQQENISPEYGKRIHAFTLKQLLNGKINRSLAYLYRNVLMAEDMNEELRLKLQRLAFANELTVSGSIVCKSCIVRQKGIKEQTRYFFKNQKTIIYLYSEDYTVLFEDMNGRLCQLDEEYRIHAYMDYSKVQKLLKGCRNLSVGEQLYLFHKEPLQALSDAREFDGIYKNYIWLLQQDALESAFKKELAADLIHAFQKWEMHQDAESLLSGMQAGDFFPKDRSEFILALLSAGLYEKAYLLIHTYGYEKIPLRPLLGVCVYMIQNNSFTLDQKLLKLAYYVYSRNKFTDEILLYLNMYYIGTLRQMMDIFHSALSMDVPAYELSGRILEQIIFTKNYGIESVDVFRYYSKQGRRRELTGIYLSVLADEYLTSDKMMPEDLWILMNGLMLEGERISAGAQLALLKYHSEHVDTLTPEEQTMCVGFLAESLGEDIYLSFFKAFEPLYPVLEIYGEKICVEYRSKQKQTIIIHYMAEKAGNDEVTYYTEEMEEVYPGIYQKAFRVFWGESIPYYITMMVDGQEQFCINGELDQIESDAKAAKGRFRYINELSMALELEDYSVADELIQKYEEEKYLTFRMLKLK